MSRLVPITTALVLALAAPTAVLADPGNGKGGDKQERGNRGGDDNGRGNGNNGNGNNGNGRGAGNGNGRGGDDRPDVRLAVAPDGRAVVVARDDRGGRGSGRGDDDVRDLRRELQRQVFQTRDGRPVVYFSREDDRGLIAGCPPDWRRRTTAACRPARRARSPAPPRPAAMTGCGARATTTGTTATMTAICTG